MLRKRESDLGPRYWMLETIREYAADRLDDDVAEADALRLRHAELYAGLVAALADGLVDHDLEAFDRLREEQGNLRAALTFGVEHDKVAILSDLLYGLWRYWLTVGQGAEAKQWVDRYLGSSRASNEPLVRYGGDLGASEILRVTDEVEQAIALKQDLLSTSRAFGEVEIHGRALRRWLPALLSDLAHLHLDIGDLDDAHDYAEEALAVRKELGNPAGVAHALGAVAMVAYAEGDFVTARSRRVESEAGWREDGRDAEAKQAAVSIAECDLLLGTTEGVEQRLREAGDGLHGERDVAALVQWLRVAALLLAARGEWERCAALYGLADRTESEGGMRIFVTAENEVHDGVRARVKQALDETVFERAYETGAQVTDDEALQFAMDSLT